MKFNDNEIDTIDIFDSGYVRYQLGLSKLDKSFFSQEDIEKKEKYDLQQIERYKQYIVDFDKTIKEIEELLLEDYARYRKEWSDEEIIKSNGQAKGNKLTTAADDGGILLEEGGYMKIGNGDMMQ